MKTRGFFHLIWGTVISAALLSGFVPGASAQVGPTCVTPPSGLVGWWPGDGNANDIIGNNNGTVENGAAFATGEVGQAFSFVGASADVRVPHNANQNTGAQITVDAWIFINSFAPSFTTPTIINKRSGSFITTDEGYTFGLVNGFGGDNRSGPVNNGLQFEITTTNGSYLEAIVGGVVTTGQWYHVAGTSDGSAIRIFVNGSQVASSPATGTIVSVTDDLVIGKNVSNGNVFPGLIDEVELFNRALTQPEIQGIFNAGSAGKCKGCVAIPSGMVSWWPGDGNANDVVGRNNGTLQGGATFGTGEVGQAFSLDGINSFVDAGNASNLKVSSGDFTVDAWVNFSALTHPSGSNNGRPLGDMSIVDKMGNASSLQTTVTVGD